MPAAAAPQAYLPARAKTFLFVVGEDKGVEWTAAARASRIRKFGPEVPVDRRERAKQARFLQYRGFSSDQIRAALGPGEDDQDPDRDP